MSAAKHTPGPWAVSIDKHNMRLELDEQRPSITSKGNDGVWFLCRMDEGCPNVHENARLIAAAPELLEALKECRDQLQLLEAARGPDQESECARKKADNAIAKAE